MEAYGTLIDRIFSLVEEHLHTPLSLEDISEQVYLSPYHLHRVIHEITGHPLMEYLRTRRLSASLSDLLGTSRRVLVFPNSRTFGGT